HPPPTLTHHRPARIYPTQSKWPNSHPTHDKLDNRDIDPSSRMSSPATASGEHAITCQSNEVKTDLLTTAEP
ncbi:MAG: hypothetical protein AAGJ35_02130, partial [Myxococcota bacterium]